MTTTPEQQAEIERDARNWLRLHDGLIETDQCAFGAASSHIQRLLSLLAAPAPAGDGTLVTREELKRIEWGFTGSVVDLQCPACRCWHERDKGKHGKNCWLKRALTAAPGPLCRCPEGTCLLHPSLKTCGMRDRRAAPGDGPAALYSLVCEWRASLQAYEDGEIDLREVDEWHKTAMANLLAWRPATPAPLAPVEPPETVTVSRDMFAAAASSFCRRYCAVYYPDLSGHRSDCMAMQSALTPDGGGR